MAIGVGFNLYDGIVLGSDRQRISPGQTQYGEKKIFNQVNEDIVVALVGGDDLTRAAEVWRKFKDQPISSYLSCEEALTATLNDVGGSDQDLPLQLLCGFASKDTTGLLQVRGREIELVEDFRVICSGDAPLIQYLTRHMNMLWENVPRGVVFACYLLKRANDYLDSCGGPMDMLVLKPGPQIHLIESDMIDEIDKRIAKNHSQAFGNLFSIDLPFPV